MIYKDESSKVIADLELEDAIELCAEQSSEFENVTLYFLFYCLAIVGGLYVLSMLLYLGEYV